MNSVLSVGRTRAVLGRLDSRLVELALVAAVSLLGAALRFYKLGDWSFWVDELYTIGRAQAHTNWAALLDLWWRPSPSVWLTGWAISVLGVSEASARLVPAVVGSLSVPILYFPMRRMWGSSTAKIAMLLIAISPWHIFWSQNARFYTSLMLLYALAAFALFFAFEEDRPAYIGAFYVLLWLAVGERFLALFLVLVVGLYVLLLAILPMPKPRGWKPRTFAFLLAPGLLAAAGDLAAYAITGDSYLAGALELAYSTPIDDPLRLGVLVAFHLGLPVVTLALIAGIDQLRAWSRPGLFTVVGAIVPVALLLAANPFLFTVDRYVFVTLPSWIMLAAVGVVGLHRLIAREGKLLATGVLMVMVADAMGAHLLYYQVNQGNRPDWRGAFQAVEARWQPGDQLVSTRAEIGRFYTGRGVTQLVDFDPATAGSTTRYWFVLDSEGFWHASKNGFWVEQHATLVDFRYLRVWENINLRTFLLDPASPRKLP